MGTVGVGVGAGGEAESWVPKGAGEAAGVVVREVARPEAGKRAHNCSVREAHTFTLALALLHFPPLGTTLCCGVSRL